MRKIVLVYGLIAAAIFAITMFGAFPFWKNGTITFENGEYIDRLSHSTSPEGKSFHVHNVAAGLMSRRVENRRMKYRNKIRGL